MRRTTSLGSLVLGASVLLLLATPSTAHAEGKEKAGRWMANIRVGVAANLGESFDGASFCGRRNYFCYRRTQFVISPNGTVKTAAASGVDQEVSDCGASVIKAIEFPKPKGGGDVVVSSYPFEFHPSGG